MTKANKKGFTLVELLAVIAILAILLLLITPNILELFVEGERSAFLREVEVVYKTGEMRLVQDRKGKPGPYTYCYGQSGDYNNLKVNGSDETYYTITFNANAKVTEIKATNGTYHVEMTTTGDDYISINEISKNPENLKEGNLEITCPTTTTEP